MRPHEHPATIMYATWLADVAEYTTQWPSTYRVGSSSYEQRIELLHLIDGDEGGPHDLIVVYEYLKPEILTIMQIFDTTTTVVYENGKYQQPH